MAIAVVALLSYGKVEGAIMFYSINVNQNGEDELVKVDAATGQVVVIGSLGPSVLDFPSLAVANGRLFLVNPVTAATPVDLVELNPSTGAILSSTLISVAGSPIPLVEGFDSDGGQLVISYSLVSGGSFGTRSNKVGTLALNGTVSNSITLSTADDLDGIAVDLSCLHNSCRFGERNE